MITTELICRIAAMALDQLIQTRYGALGVLALLLIVVGAKKGNAICASIGALILALLMTQP
ncbi:hypothetical protein ACIRU8_41095 [Streptomyces sp. NPDC101175]|uniref:hypothetical protein n=1 Tax=Streptomyces sp. NPDC101175 TaxID=3366123 RepID=UPI0038380F88